MAQNAEEGDLRGVGRTPALKGIWGHLGQSKTLTLSTALAAPVVFDIFGNLSEKLTGGGWRNSDCVLERLCSLLFGGYVR